MPQIAFPSPPLGTFSSAVVPRRSSASGAHAGARSRLSAALKHVLRCDRPAGLAETLGAPGLGGERRRVPRKPQANSFSTRETLSRRNFLIQRREVLRAPRGPVHGSVSGCAKPPAHEAPPAQPCRPRSQRRGGGPARSPARSRTACPAAGAGLGGLCGGASRSWRSLS